MGAPRGNRNAAGSHHGKSKKNAFNAKFHMSKWKRDLRYTARRRKVGK